MEKKGINTWNFIYIDQNIIISLFRGWERESFSIKYDLFRLRMGINCYIYIYYIGNDRSNYNFTCISKVTLKNILLINILIKLKVRKYLVYFM